MAGSPDGSAVRRAVNTPPPSTTRFSPMIMRRHDAEQLLWNQCSGDLATRILAFARDSSVLVRLLTGRSIELIRLRSQHFSSTSLYAVC